MPSNSLIASGVPTWRRLPVGVEVSREGEAHARVWAPRRRTVEVVVARSDGGEDDAIALGAEQGAGSDGYFSGMLPGARAGTRYRLRLDGERTIPDPVSRFQPEGPHGPSQIVDPSVFQWTDAAWRGATLAGQVIVEVHVGTFTPEGTWRAAIERLPLLAETGITAVEIMPVAEFPGRFGWGYDGVGLFAPTRLYGTPDDLRAFVDAAHGHGLAVLLDVVYNHLGPDGNYLRELSDWYFKGQTEWGEALNFDGPHHEPVRELFLANAAYWIDEFHMDGLRLDATQQIFDRSEPHIVTEIARTVHETARRAGRGALVIGENEPQHADLVRGPERGGALDALWNDDFHHCAVVALTGRDEAYYSGYRGSAQELVSAAKYGFLYQGEHFEWQDQRRGTPALDVAPAHFVHFVENHDQVANSATGRRLHQLASPGRYRALMALTLLLPQTPMLFQGQEWSASAPFLYFADHEPGLARLVRRGRKEFLTQFPSVAAPETATRLADPGDPATFERCRLDWSERERPPHAQALALVRDLLRLRRDDPALAAQGGAPAGLLDGAVLGDRALALRFGDRTRSGEPDRLLVVNLGPRFRATPLAEPLVAPPAGMVWRTRWSSDDPRYGGDGTPPVETDAGWVLPAECAVVLAPISREHAGPAPPAARTEKEARAQWKERSRES